MNKSRFMNFKEKMVLFFLIIGIVLVNGEGGIEAKAESITKPTPINEIFPDSTLAELMRGALKKESTFDLVTASDLKELSDAHYREFFLAKRGIKSIEGIQYFDLNYISLYGNEISDLSPLSKMPQLIGLELDDNKIKDLTPLGNLSELFRLELKGNQISDLSPLNNLSALKYLSVSDQKIVNEPVDFQENVTISNKVFNPNRILVKANSISNAGIQDNGEIKWSLKEYVNELSYEFNEEINMNGTIKSTFSGTVIQPLIDAPIKYKVIFNEEGKKRDDIVEKGTMLTEPTAPIKEGYTFIGWYDKMTDGKKWNFIENKVTEEGIQLYARFIKDNDNNVSPNDKINDEIVINDASSSKEAKIVKTPKEGTLPSIKKIDNDETNTVLLPTNSNREEGVSKQDSNKLPSTGDANSLTIFLQLGGL
ncbi:hypothetical protein EHS75_15055, partial [Listeria monocytogenes]|nr:hypothetical protein [Listeria monocytogenes]EAD3730143.1 hypothetical protein [Listeria monocytogenes]EAH3621955.1 hypothetical protein [Listeria monocytogenes]